ncbi:MAG: MiaB/RimO family radical SAM methylthiotransferase [Candidatus Nealsonbacteria bacterium]
MKYHIITYGCQMNKADSERIASNLKIKRHKPAQNINEADLIIVNMCSIRQPAVDRIYGLIQKFKKIKKKRKIKTLLTGCVLKKDLNKLRGGFDSIWDQSINFDCPPKYNSSKTIYIPISNGCNNFCSYCVVPYTRGALVCRDHKKIIEEIKEATKKDIKDIWLLGQNVNDYKSPKNKNINFSKLFKLADEIPGKFKLSFMSPNPKNFSDELIKNLSESKHYSKYLNLPVQSGDDVILKKMNRSYTIKKYNDLVKRIKKAIPDIKLSTDIIIGFPGETKKQFKNTEKLFKKIKFNVAFVSKYSPRIGTASFKLKDNVPFDEKKKREQAIIKIVNKHE